jgi:hypothetical protein
MNSFISSFKALVVAVAVIGIVEISIYAMARPNLVERSNYLDWNYDSSEYLHKLIVFNKLSLFSSSSPDIVQVGDSSGFYGIIPEIVSKFVGGKKYVNLSCCANTGFDGYYDIAKFVLDRNSKAKTLVLYITPNHLPSINLQRGDELVGGAARIHESFVSPWASLSPPSQSLRPAITKVVYSLNGYVRPMSPRYPGAPEARMSRSVKQNLGWWMEDDFRMTERAQQKYFTSLCGEENIYRPNLLDRIYYQQNRFGQHEFIPEGVFARFAELAAAHGATLVIAFHPHPCSSMWPQDLDVLRSMLRSVQAKHQNVSVLPDSIFEHWPSNEFTSFDHLRVGYDVLASARLGRLLATNSGIELSPPSPDESNEPYDETPDANAHTPSLLKDDVPNTEWHASGITLDRSEHSGEIEMVENTSNTVHHVETTVEHVVPGKPYVLSVEVKPIGEASLSLVMRDLHLPGRLGNLSCYLQQGKARREDWSYEADIEELSDGWYRCWVSMALCDSAAAIGLFVTDSIGTDTHVADRKRGLLVRNVMVQQGWRLIPLNPSAPPFPKIYPPLTRCQQE